MSIFTQLKQQLSQQIKKLVENTGLVELQAHLCLDEPLNLLAWLKAQSHFPQHFWQSRDHDLIFATLGAVREFDDLDQAQQFSQHYGFRLFGGLKFEGECRFILPRLVLTQSAKNLTAYLYFDADKKAEYLEWLAHFEKLAELENQQNTLISQHSINDFTRWEKNIAQAITAIQAGHFRKVVLANATTLHFLSPISSYDLLAASQQKNYGCYHFLWAENAFETFIGSSPEQLYQRQIDQFETEALAGTVAASEDLKQTKQNALWLLTDHKNIEENQYVVDDIRSHLSDLVSQFQVSQVRIKRLHNLQHLQRNIHATLHKNVPDADCLTRIHPTAAVAGLPRHSALQFIHQYEGFERGWYAGTLGSFTPKQAEFCVALRSAKIVKNEITLYAGAGIVEGSLAESEWDEISRKRLALADLLR